MVSIGILISNALYTGPYNCFYQYNAVIGILVLFAFIKLVRTKSMNMPLY